jgi:hypothetical protein
MNAAGATAHSCGWSMNRTDSTVNNAQPSANASSTTPVRAFSLAGTNGATTRATATIRPAAIDIATTEPIPILAVRGVRPGGRWLLWRIAVVMIASPGSNYPGATQTVAAVRIPGLSTVRQPDSEVQEKPT